MKGLKKVALASAIAAVSAGAQAELKALDDATLGETTGQAGLTIDIETKWTIGEFMYKDAVSDEDGGSAADGGSVLITGISLGGNTDEAALAAFAPGSGLVTNGSSFVDNIRLTLDVSNGVETLNYGMSEVIALATILVSPLIGNGDGDILNASTATASASGLPSALASDGVTELALDLTRTFGDGDLVIHDGFKDPFQKLDSGDGVTGGFAANILSGSLAAVDYDTVLDAGTRAVDFNFKIDGLGIASTAYEAGDGIAPVTGSANTALDYNEAAGTDADATTTRLLSGIDIKGYLGPVDIHIENDGNGFDGTGDLAVAGIDANAGNADSIINWDRYFRITDLDIYIDIAGVQLKQVQIHNTRGDETGLNASLIPGQNTTSLGFAHSLRQIYAVRNNVLNLERWAAIGGGTGLGDAYVDGVAINTQFKGDIDVGHLSFGDTDESIGQIFLTDIESHTNWTISAH